jgi:predicted aspartyl protease
MHRILVTAACCALFCVAARAAVPLTPAGNGHLLVPATINGKGPFPVILDTGADGSGLYTWFVRQQGLKAGPTRDLGGMTGTVTVPTYVLDSMAIDGRLIRNITADSYPDRKDGEIEVGVAGNDLMDGTVTVFDFPCGQVQIWPKPVDMATLLTPKARMLEGGSVIDGTQLTFTVTINGVHGVAVLDTGSRDTRINSKFAEAAGIDTSSPGFHDSDIVYGANSKGMSARQGPIGTVNFAGLSVAHAQARVMDLPVLDSFGIGSGPAMIFGLDLMQGFRLVYDHEAKRFWFDESKCQADQASKP